MMPDISMCMGEQCPKKETCYRHKAEPSEYRQAYFMYAPFNHEQVNCEYFMEIEKDVNLRNE